ncbi:MAG TPA: phage holin family protein [Gemmatimonadaceae bacterium]|nr:phage holin family protein [Gemmatimonadaceae bacterium]
MDSGSLETFERTRGFGVLLRDLANGSTQLLRGEVKLARMELTAITANVGRGTAQVALGGVMLLLGGLALLAGLILLVGDQWLPRDLYWLSALLVLVVTGTIAALFVRRGLHRLSPAELAPDQTVETLKEDKEWLKQQLTSGATSN